MQVASVAAYAATFLFRALASSQSHVASAHVFLSFRSVLLLRYANTSDSSFARSSSSDANDAKCAGRKDGWKKGLGGARVSEYARDGEWRTDVKL
mmetsp:Transcript_10369/g.32814  ORF Transcript_10369/g.32814 Transcript_10369/m.32814 type:complete len:95 (-) Transcript_10369:4710-4994(-)